MSKNEYWEQRWQQGQTGWDLQTVSPPIADYAGRLTNKNLRILIPGCGNAHEARFLIEHGFTNVTVIDIAPTPVDLLKEQMVDAINKGYLRVLCGDFFTHAETYDLILEQTFFCAILPEQRTAYASQMKKLLAPQGKLVGVLFNRMFDGGPPFGGTVQEYQTYFEPLFNKVTFTPCMISAAPRLGTEVWFEVE